MRDIPLFTTYARASVYTFGHEPSRGQFSFGILTLAC